MAEHTKVYSVAALVSWYVRDARVSGLDERTLRQFVAWCEENGRPVEVAVPAPRAVGEPEQPKVPWSGQSGNWVAPMHFCPSCGGSLSWKESEDALEQGLIWGRCVSCRFSASIYYRAAPRAVGEPNEEAKIILHTLKNESDDLQLCLCDGEHYDNLYEMVNGRIVRVTVKMLRAALGTPGGTP